MKQILSGIFTVLNSGEKKKLWMLILFDLVIGVLDIAFLGILLLIINFYTRNTVAIKSNFIPASLLNQNSIWLIGLFCVLFCIKNLFGFAGLKAQHHFFYGVASRLSKRNMLHYFKCAYLRYVDIDSSVFIRNISQQPIEFSAYILTNFQQVVSQTILIVFTVCAILFYHPTLFLLLFLLLLPPVVLLAWFIRRKLKNIRSQIKTVSEKTLQHLHESLAGFVEGKVYDKVDFFTERFYQYQSKLDENIATQQTLHSLPSRLMEVFAVLGFFILVAINKLSANTPVVDVLTIGIFMAAAYKIIPGIIKILNSTGQMKTYQFTVTDLILPVDSTSTSIDDKVSAPIQSLSFDKVYFRHKDQQILNNASFTLLPGDFAGISAPSGTGKTTLVNLLLGFLKPDSGVININDDPSDPEQLQTLHNRISYVKQQPFFIHDTMLKNITLTDGQYNRDKLAEVVSFCGLGELVAGYPEGLEKTITENGKNISGGQRQRIMLARAFYHDFDLLILDEPFSEMDDRAEIALLLKLQELTKQGKMVLFITHKKESLRYCNKMIGLDGK